MYMMLHFLLSCGRTLSSVPGFVFMRVTLYFHPVAGQVYIDVLESVNLLMSSNGAVLRNDVSGKVIMKTLLSGVCGNGKQQRIVAM